VTDEVRILRNAIERSEKSCRQRIICTIAFWGLVKDKSKLSETPSVGLELTSSLSPMPNMTMSGPRLIDIPTSRSCSTPRLFQKDPAEPRLGLAPAPPAIETACVCEPSITDWTATALIALASAFAAALTQCLRSVARSPCA
jgi:hypothetical protein